MLRLANKLPLLLLLSLPLHLWALASDRNQVIEIEADHAQLDDEQGISQYKGKAILTQGTLRIEGDIITFYYDEDRQLTKAVAYGKRATYQQVEKQGEAPVRAKAYDMEYHAKAQKIYLLGKAYIWQDGGEFNGERIVYDIARNTVDASGGNGRMTGGNQVEPKKNDRIHIIIQPPSRNKKPTVKPVTVITAPTPTTAPVESALKNDSYPTTITAPSLNIRTGPGTQYNKLAVLSQGARVFILTEQKHWVQIRSMINGQDVIGWVNRRYINSNKH